MKWVYIFSILIFSFINSHAQKHTINGYVNDKASGEALIGANIYNMTSNIGTTTNTHGFYSASFMKGSIQLTFSYVGYEAYQINLVLDRDTVINVSLKSNTLLQELVVSAESVDPNPESSLMSAVSIKADQVSNFPALMGETDMLKTLQLIPGVQSGNEGSNGIYVRGGGPDQNLILLDGVPVYNVSHLLGFFSVFNSDALDNIQLIKGGFPARYGGRLSSVVDIEMKEGNYKELKGQGSVGLISSKITLDGPIKADRASFLISLRRTYIDVLAYPLMKKIQTEKTIPRYFFYDFNLKLNHKASSRDQFSLTAYSGKDKAFSRHDQQVDDDSGTTTYKEEYGIKWGNLVASMKWNRVIGHNFFANMMFTYSNYGFDLYEQSEKIPSGSISEFYKGEYISGIEDIGFKLDFEYIPNKNHHLHFGTNIIDHTFRPGAIHFQSLWEVDTTWGASNTYSREFSTYIEDDYNFNDWLKVNLGLHYSGFLVEGKYYQSLQPRISSRIMLGRNFSFKGSYADMTQYIHLLSNSGIGLPTDLWAPATSKIKPQKSQQIAAGFAKNTSGIELTIEGFYKEMDNLIEYKEGATFLHIDQDWQDKVVSGKGNSYGAEFFTRKPTGIVSGWVGYTLSWSNREFMNSFLGYQKIEKFPYRYDRRHDFSIVMVTKIRKNTNFTWSWVFGSGSAVTLPVSSYNSMYPDYSSGNSGFMVESRVYVKKNGYRMRDYHRLDLGFSITKETKWGERVWHIGTFNTYNRSNAYFIDMGHDMNKKRTFIQRSLFPLIPSVSYSFKF
jgi:outer membrane receptor for ferrienterochelin and colicin